MALAGEANPAWAIFPAELDTARAARLQGQVVHFYAQIAIKFHSAGWLYKIGDRMGKFVCMLGLCLMLAACGPPRPMTFEEQQAYMAKQQCIQEATNMNPEWPMASNPAWYAYFTMCMNQLGISNAAINRMWLP